MKGASILAKFLKEKRVASGMSQKEVADKLGYTTPQFISNWERGVSSPPINAIKQLGVMYKVKSEDLFEVVLAEEIRITTETLKRKFKLAR
ncbi:helix-turn-helix transcriptional regulator [Bdellovibrio sp. NC01]|uniref:helix-turn-helix transcriptional regulator n=1 Tax=Bdellovibrio sp. NC01 TaxID=2220073 RepID=UPI0011595552|nr:helix-turn-helix transcriptional regulator [Bdellovibrio sp. NC01]QDK37960.1 XRE family transcriptional regulator [Bdellovibrio sp. NC01]